jgi:hypothetical protein
MKECFGCKLTKPVTEFHMDKSPRTIKNKEYPPLHRNYCKQCRSLKGINPATESKKIMKLYGMPRPPLGTPCDLCGRTKTKLFFDHCHKTKKFRGWLCNTCNAGIGKLGDNVEGLEKAINYLKREIVFDSPLF